MDMISSAKWFLEKHVQSNPYSYFYLKKLVRNAPLFFPFLPHDPSFLGFCHLIKKPGRKKFFLDIGANDGISALSFYKLCRDYKIVSIEANPFHRDSLEKIKQRIPNFEYHITGFGDSESSIELYVPFFKHIPIHSAASMHLDILKKSFAKNFAKIFTRTEFKKTTVHIIPGDRLQLAPGLIKIDTEGHDYAVLCGLQDTLKHHQPSILIENNIAIMDKVHPLLRNLGYNCFFFDHVEDRFFPYERQDACNLYFLTEDDARFLALPWRLSL